MLISNCDSPKYFYRICINDLLYLIPEDEVVELESEEIINHDHTPREWISSVTKDALVKDGNYVKAIMETFGMNKPVKEIEDQADYAGAWRRLYAEEKNQYRTNGGVKNSEQL
jgi:hypothetical protein